MPRHHLSDPRVQNIVDRLVAQFLRVGSVNALADDPYTAPYEDLRLKRR